MATTVMWFRRDLRLADNPALRHAVDAARSGPGDSGVVPLYVVDPVLWDPAGASRRAYLVASLGELGERIGGWQLRQGHPVVEVVATARAAGASQVHVAADHGPYGSRRDAEVEAALAEHDIALVRTGSPYAISPGRVRKADGSPYAVFTPFWRAWTEHGWRAPVEAPRGVAWVRPLDVAALPAADPPPQTTLPPAGEAAARHRWRRFVSELVDGYDSDRNRPDLDRTSRMSVHLKWGEIHPRTMLADLAGAGDASGAQRGAATACAATAASWPSASSTPTSCTTTRPAPATT